MKNRIVISLALIGLFSVGSAYAMTNTQAKQLATAAYNGNTADLANLETAAKGGNAAAQLGLGEYYSSEKYYTKAVYWWNKAAAQGDTKADYDLGAAQGKAAAELLQGNLYFKGIGVPQNYGKAVYSWNKAADQGNASAENNLGNAYYYGQGVPQNYAKANYWF
ncbi:SEL1-like repeat protein, partial [Acidithiobacillus ferridurans]|nr:sel1 repeat family protein [Acidithiobacillus ferridurans]